MKRSQPKRDWSAAREKVDCEGQCRYCHASTRLQAAHIIGREHDKDYPGSQWTVLPDRIVPLCATCHGEYDRHEIDLLPYLIGVEQVQAVRDAGGIALALRRISGRPDPKREAA